MREGRVELPHLAVLDPKSSASASSATLALQKDQNTTTFSTSDKTIPYRFYFITQLYLTDGFH